MIDATIKLQIINELKKLETLTKDIAKSIILRVSKIRFTEKEERYETGTIESVEKVNVEKFLTPKAQIATGLGLTLAATFPSAINTALNYTSDVGSDVGNQMSSSTTPSGPVKQTSPPKTFIGRSIERIKTKFGSTNNQSMDAPVTQSANTQKNNLSKQEKDEGYANVMRIAAKYGDKFPEVTAAQWASESAWGQRPSGKNNFFGQKAKNSEPGTIRRTEEVYNGKRVIINDKFKDYSSLEESVADHVRRWSTKYKGAATPEEAIQILQQNGYATDPNFVNLLTSIIRGRSTLIADVKNQKSDKLVASNVESIQGLVNPSTATINNTQTKNKQVNITNVLSQQIVAQSDQEDTPNISTPVPAGDQVAAGYRSAFL